jgi:thiol:disulfide interchange protein DsbD
MFNSPKVKVKMNAIRFMMLAVFVFSALGALQAQPKFPDLPLKMEQSSTIAKNGDEVVLTFTANIPKDYYVYSSNIKCEIGPLPPSLEIRGDKNIEIIGNFTSIGDKKEMDDIFNCQIAKWTKKVLLTHKVKVKDASKATKIEIELQMCSSVSGVCLPVSKKFDVVFESKKNSSNPSDTEPAVSDPKDKKSDEKILPAAKVGEQTKVDNGTDNVDTPNSEIDSLNLEVESQVGDKVNKLGAFVNNKEYRAKSQAEVGQCKDLVKSYNGVNILDDFNKGGLWGLLILSFLAGLAALITPCVFPMIPMTVTFFLKQSKSRTGAIVNALMFGLFIVVVYMIIGLIFGSFFTGKAINYIATAALPNILFFIIFFIFACSFFGAFELTLPASWTTKLDQKADKGGYLGIFFMALTLAVVSFSCTGPIVATVLVQSADGELIKPLLAMAGFGFALALPFMLAAIFPSMLNSMPKSGGWLNSVKVCLGFIEIAFGLKFLSVADQTYHWGLLDREIYLAIWIALFTLMGLYLLGKMKFAHDSDLKFISIPRLMFVVITFTFVVYLIPGMWGAPLKGLSGYLPPMGTQDFKLGTFGSGGNVSEEPLYGDRLEIPLGLEGYFDYDQALRVAAELEKPLFLDFTGHGCVNCRKMEEKVWDDPRILKTLREDYIVVSLYVDDKVIPLPKDDYFISKADGDSVKMLGDKNAAIQQCLYGVLAQPQYVLIDYNQNLLASPQYSDFKSGNKERFYKFLKSGVNRFEAKLNN